MKLMEHILKIIVLTMRMKRKKQVGKPKILSKVREGVEDAGFIV